MRFLSHAGRKLKSGSHRLTVGSACGRFSLSIASDDNSSMESSHQQVGEPSVENDDVGSQTTARKILKVLRNPRLAAALFNAQLRIRGKARLPLSVRLFGRIRLRADGDVEFGQGVTLLGDVVPIEFVSY